ARPGLQRDTQRQRDAQDLLRLAFRFDQDGGHDRQTGLDRTILAGQANRLCIGVLAFRAYFGPGRKGEARLFALLRLRLSLCALRLTRLITLGRGGLGLLRLWRRRLLPQRLSREGHRGHRRERKRNGCSRRRDHHVSMLHGMSPARVSRTLPALITPITTAS